MGLGSTQRPEVKKMIQEAQRKLSSDQKEGVIRILSSEAGKNKISKIIGGKLLAWGLISLAVLTGITGLSLKEIHDRVNTNMENLVADQFQEPRIQQIVNEAAKDRASTLMEKQIQPDVNNFKLEVGKQVRDVNESVVTEVDKFKREMKEKIQDVNEFVASETESIQKILEELQQKNKQVDQSLVKMRDMLLKSADAQNAVAELIAFQTTCLRAQNDDREAYDQLAAWHKDKNAPVSNELLQKIILNINLPYVLEHRRNAVQTVVIPWNEGVDPNKALIGQLTSQYSKSPPSVVNSGIVRYIWEREDYPKEDRIQFLIEVLKTDKNLRAVNLAGHFLSKDTKIAWNPFNIEPFVDWWEKEKSKQIENDTP